MADVQLYQNGWESYEKSGQIVPKMYKYSSPDPWSSGGMYGGHYKYSDPYFYTWKVGHEWDNDSCIHFHNTNSFPVKITRVAIGACAVDSNNQTFVSASGGGIYTTTAYPVVGHGASYSVKIRVTSDEGSTWQESTPVSYNTPNIGWAAKTYADSHHSAVTPQGVANVYDTDGVTVIGYAYFNSTPEIIKVTDIDDKLLWASSVDPKVNMNKRGRAGNRNQDPDVYSATFGRDPFGNTAEGYSKYTGFTFPEDRTAVAITDCPVILPNADAFLHFSVDLTSIPSADVNNFGVAFNMNPNTEESSEGGGSDVDVEPIVSNYIWVMREVDGQKQWVLSQPLHVLKLVNGVKTWVPIQI